MSVLRCVCHNLSLAALNSYAERHGISSFEELRDATRCGSNCGTCRPYIEEMLRTGRVPTTADVRQYTDLKDLFIDEAPEGG